ncbi:MAG TPA: acylphosphatase [Thermoguttaceae bacterium]|nr:acylphosphatase [Thermoguttaceae bacterium]
MSDSTQRREIFFSGRVQGVGFRYTARWIAQRFAVGGYVQNLPDGRVRIVVEGTADEIDRFLAAIDAELGRYIRDKKEEIRPPVGESSTFEIRF